MAIWFLQELMALKTWTFRKTLPRGRQHCNVKDATCRKPFGEKNKRSTCGSGTLVSAPWGSTSCSARSVRLCALQQFQLRERPVRTSVLPRRPTCVFRLNLSRWVPWLQTASFCPLYSPTPRSPPTGSRRKSSSGTGAPLRMRWPESGASSSRSRWDWRRSPHFRVRMDQPHTTPCQVNISKSLNSPSDGLTPALCSASWQYIRVKCAQRAGEFRLREGVLKVKPQSTTGTGSGVIVWPLSL